MAAFIGVVTVSLVLATRAETPTPRTSPSPMSPSATTVAPFAETNLLRALTTTSSPLTTDVSTTDVSTAVVSTTATTAAPRLATLSFSGDVLLHSRVWRVAADPADEDGYDFAPMFEPVRPWIEAADWSVCHLEVNLDGANENLSSFPVFRGPGAIATDLASVGFDGCSTASNHSLDRGTAATFETIEVLEAAGLRHTGTARTPEESASSTWYDIEGIRVAHLAYAYWFNGFTLPDDQPWAANLIDEQRILDDAAAARAGGADFIVLSLHWGDQYRHEPNRQQADLGPKLLASDDIDLIIGHHAHVVQPIEHIDGEWLVYGVGNLLSNQTQLVRRDELIVTATVVEQDDGSFAVDRLEVLPVFVDLDTLTIHPSGPGLRADRVPDRLDPALDASWARVNEILQRGSGWGDLELVGS